VPWDIHRVNPLLGTHYDQTYISIYGHLSIYLFIMYVYPMAPPSGLGLTLYPRSAFPGLTLFQALEALESRCRKRTPTKPTCISICSYLSIYLSFYLSVYLSIYLSIYLTMYHVCIPCPPPPGVARVAAGNALRPTLHIYLYVAIYLSMYLSICLCIYIRWFLPLQAL